MIISFKKLFPLADEELPMDPEFAIMISIVPCGLLEDGTEIPYRNRGIKVRPLLKVDGNTFKCLAPPTQKTGHDFIASLNDIVGPPENILDADETDVDRKSFIECKFDDNVYSIKQQSIDHISHLLNHPHV